jgi:hypothetical protein
MIDPRLFLTLPEHASSANHLWNCALFMTQMSHMNNQLCPSPVKLSLTSNSPSQSLDNEVQPHSPTSSNEPSSFEAILNDMKQAYAKLYPSSISNSYMSLINETISNVMKIKKRNKASYFHLALVPFNYYTPNTAPLILSNEDEAKTMPWLTGERVLDAYTNSACCSSSGTDDYDDEEGFDSEKINESDESNSRAPSVDLGCRR